jgi:hypothetical protein
MRDFAVIAAQFLSNSAGKRNGSDLPGQDDRDLLVGDRVSGLYEKLRYFYIII